MKRRNLWLSLFLGGCLAASSTGCELWNRLGLRQKSNEDTELAEPSKGSDSESTRGFFKPTRLSGALSDEGREIEQHLGVP